MDPHNIRAIVVHDAALRGEWVAGHLPPQSGVSVDAVLDTLSPDAELLRSSEADVLVAACASDSEEALRLVAWWSVNRPDRPIVVICSHNANGFVSDAFAAGADDLVIVHAGPDIASVSSREVVFAVEKAVARKSTPIEGVVATGKLISVLGPKGGIGKTVTSCNLSLCLTARRKRVVLVDLDLQFGDVALSLGLNPQTTIYDLATSGGSLDQEKIDAYLMSHSSGLRVLAAPLRPDQADGVTTAFLNDVYAVLARSYDYVVIDTPPAFTAEVIATIDASTYVCMVGMLDALSLKNTRLGLETLELMGYESERIRILLNRANTSVGITGADVVSILGRSPDILVPSHRDIARSVNEGTPVALSQRKSDAAKAFDQLAGLFATPEPVAASPRRGRSLKLRGRN
jgi:pilus assembly protein CpaE